MSTPTPPPDPLPTIRETRTIALAGLVLGLVSCGFFLICLVLIIVQASKEPDTDAEKTQTVYNRSSGDLAEYEAEHNTAYVPVDYADPVLNNQRAIFLHGNINNLTARNVVLQLRYLNGKDPRKPIHLYLTTFGGGSDSAFSVLDTMQEISAPVNVYALAGAESSGAMILVGATGKRYATSTSVIMVHANSEPAEKGETKIYDNLDLDRLETLWRSRSHLPQEWYPLTGDKEYYLTAQEALKYGVIDAIQGNAKAPFAPK